MKSIRIASRIEPELKDILENNIKNNNMNQSQYIRKLILDDWEGTQLQKNSIIKLLPEYKAIRNELTFLHREINNFSKQSNTWIKHGINIPEVENLSETIRNASLVIEQLKKIEVDIYNLG